MKKLITTIEDGLLYLQNVRGNAAKLVAENTVAFFIGERPVIVSINEKNNTMTISCQVAKFDEATDPSDLLQMLKLNINMAPFAYALVIDEGDESASIVLLDSIPIGDLSEDELDAAMDSLRLAIAIHEKSFNQQ